VSQRPLRVLKDAQRCRRFACPSSQEYPNMSTILISLLRNIETFEHIRVAVCAAREYERELSVKPADAGTRNGAGTAAIVL